MRVSIEHHDKAGEYEVDLVYGYMESTYGKSVSPSIEIYVSRKLDRPKRHISWDIAAGSMTSALSLVSDDQHIGDLVEWRAWQWIGF